jgi:hypothetical protein
MSKSHPNMSVEFKKKQQVRKDRANERQFLREAKEEYHRLYPDHKFTQRKELN